MKKAHTAAIVIALAAAAAVLLASRGSVLAPERPARLVFVGDMMFDRTIRGVAERRGGGEAGYGHVLSCAAGYLRGFDLAVGNLEGPITSNPSTSAGTKPGDPGNTRFTFDLRVAAALADAGFGAVSLANNHIRDFGRAGEDETVSALAEAGVLSFGAPARSAVATTTVHGKRIALVAFNEFLGLADPAATEAAIRKVRPDADFVAVYAHWGEEYVAENAYQRALARRFVDAGADMVLGSHPHVVQAREEYRGRHIYYSLGNFVFDQYWNEEVRTGLAVEVTVGGDGEGRQSVSVSERPVDIARTGLSCPR